MLNLCKTLHPFSLIQLRNFGFHSKRTKMVSKSREDTPKSLAHFSPFSNGSLSSNIRSLAMRACTMNQSRITCQELNYFMNTGKLLSFAKGSKNIWYCCMKSTKYKDSASNRMNHIQLLCSGVQVQDRLKRVEYLFFRIQRIC